MSAHELPDAGELTKAQRDLLKRFRRQVDAEISPASSWRLPVTRALKFLGGQADRHTRTLALYDHRRFGPYLGVSDEGSSGRAIRSAAHASPKALALRADASPLSRGVALDAERLGGVGEVPVGPDEFAHIWFECAGRTLMTTNVGSRVNLRLYRQPPRIDIAPGDAGRALASAKQSLAAVFEPFLRAPGGPRPLTVFVAFGPSRSVKEQRELLRRLRAYVQKSDIAAPGMHKLGLFVAVGGEDKRALQAVFQGIEVARSAGISQVAVEGVVRGEAERVISLPGLLNFFDADKVTRLLEYASSREIELSAGNEVDPDTVAREIWSTLNTARAMGFDLGKYGLFPLRLEECNRVVELLQIWFADWCAAPVFYADQGILTAKGAFVGPRLEKGMKLWLRMVAKHGVKVVLIDTVDKAQGWRIFKENGDAKGLLIKRQIAALTQFAGERGIKVMWAGSISVGQAYELGKLGVFGIYVTTSVSRAARVTGADRRDPALASAKRPMRGLIEDLKSVLEAGFLLGRFTDPSSRQRRLFETQRVLLEAAGTEPKALKRILPTAWRVWWRSLGSNRQSRGRTHG